MRILLVLLVLIATACGRPSSPEPYNPAPAPATASDSFKPIPDAPQRDLFDLARRLRGVEAVPLPESLLYAMEPSKSSRTFRGLDINGPHFFEFEAVVEHISENAVWYFPIDAAFNRSQLTHVAHKFETLILPTVLESFAPNLVLPGRIAIVHGEFPGMGGYFNGSDSLPIDVYPNSNQRVGLFLNMGIDLDSIAYFGTLSHELQHLVHWHVDQTEEVWIQEGLAELAAKSLGYTSLPLHPYTQQPNIALREWPSGPGEALPHYAAASLFAQYLHDRLGPQGITTLVSEPLDGIHGIESVLLNLSIVSNFKNLYSDWLVANVMSDPNPPYDYKPESKVRVERVLTQPGLHEAEVHQMGVWYLRIRPEKPLDIRFDGNERTPLLPVRPYSGETCWWSNRGDAINSTLTRAFDLTSVDSATLGFRGWWDIEEHWDHAYVSASIDGGNHWAVLTGSHSLTTDPLGTKFGDSYTGSSQGWRREHVDLSSLAGQKILLRFEYVTDEAVNNDGWCIDDISIPEIAFFDDVESQSNWTARGFVPANDPHVAQEFSIRLIDDQASEASVTSLETDASGDTRFRVDSPATLVITAFAQKTSQPGAFELIVTEAR